MFYAIDVTYVGPSKQPDHLYQRIRIQTKPGHTNMSGEEKVKGWLGTTNDWNHEALGEFDEQGARSLLKRFGIKLPSTSSITLGDYSYGTEQSEWHNERFQY